MGDVAPNRMLGALRHRNYRLFLVGQIVSTIGTWMQTVALPWLALQLTHNGFLVGLVLAAQFLPVLLLSPFAGEIADRYHKRTVLLLTQTSFVFPPFVLFALTATGHAQYWMVIVAAVVTGTINALDVPTRQSFQVEMVGKQDLLNAIALNSSVFNGSAVIGPSIAGVLIAVVGVPICFLLNSVSYIAAIGALLAMRDLPKAVHHRDELMAVQTGLAEDPLRRIVRALAELGATGGAIRSDLFTAAVVIWAPLSARRQKANAELRDDRPDFRR